MQTKRHCSGSYEVWSGDLAVTIQRRDDLDGWIAAAQWDRHLYTDPVPTKAAAVREAAAMLAKVPAESFQWLTTAPNPRSAATGHDAGQRGWKLHAVRAAANAKFADLRGRVALCGVRPRHGWSLDMFVEQKCARCAAKMGR